VSAIAAQPRIGDVVAGKYRIERQLGAGGMGVVYAAMHVHLNEPVALKMMLPEGEGHQGVRERFLREAQTAVKIRSEHVARVSDLGFLESGAPYMAMELLDGRDLAAVLSDHGPMPVSLALDYVLQACEAIAEAHALGMVHRDLKPANLFLTRRPDGSPFVKVLDFGISKSPSAQTEARLTSTGALMGSPSYMSPEQIRDAKQVDQRCDVWAVGMLLYELLTNRSAFDATTVPGLLASIVADPPRPIEALRPDLPPGLVAAIMRCLEKDLSRRTQSIAELARSVAPFAPPSAQQSVERIGRLPAPSAGVTPPVTSRTAFDETAASGPLPAISSRRASEAAGVVTGSPSWGNTVDPRPRKRPGVIAIAAIVAVAALAILATVGSFALRYLPRADHASASRPPPPDPAAPVTPASASAAPLASAVPPASAPVASAAPSTSPSVASSSAPKKRGGKATAPAPDNGHGDLGGAIDSRK
jgi:serine/threonine-protein kinase